MAGDKKKSSFFWIRLRQLSQAFCLLLFVFLFIKTDYNGTDELEYAVNIVFRLNPLIATCAMLAGKTIITLFFPALITVFFTLLLGRFFCGWFCPMGTLLDYTDKYWRGKRTKTVQQPTRIKYILLVVIITGAFFGLPVVGYFDPFSLLVRGMTLSVFPALNSAVTSFFTMTYQFGPDWLNGMTEPVYSLLKATILPFKQKYYNLALLSLGLLLMVFFLEKFGRRFFCRNICPLGAFLSLIARFSFFRGFGGMSCDKCRKCKTICRMGAIDDNRQIAPDRCNLCLDCIDTCPQNFVSFRFGVPDQKTEFESISRRIFIGSIITGVLLPSVLKTRVIAQQRDPLIIRPPGALPEEDFTGACVRCGECMKVCINNALQPLFLETGLEGIFTPKLLPRLGYCEYNCTLCGQVCPSGAIQKLPLHQKKKIVIGRAHFDKNRCLPYAKGVPCIVCEEHCPTPAKAIKFRITLVKNTAGENIYVKQPYIIDERCIGCGICENKCPVDGAAAVIVTNDGESRE